MLFSAEWFNENQGGDFQDLNSQVDKRLVQIRKVVMQVAKLEYVSQDAATKFLQEITPNTVRQLASKWRREEIVI